MLQSFLHSIHVITVIVLSKFQVTITDKPKWSNTSKDNHFHNVPIYYWDWVPIINNSKQTKDDEFSKIEAASKFFRYHDPNPETISTYKREDRSYDPPHRPGKHINQSAQKKHGCHTYHSILKPPFTVWLEKWDSHNSKWHNIKRNRGRHRNYFLYPHQKRLPVKTSTTSYGFNLRKNFNFLSSTGIQHKPATKLDKSPNIKVIPASYLTKIMGTAIALLGFIVSAEEILRNLIMQISPYLSWFDGTSSRLPSSTLSSSSISPSSIVIDCIKANDHVDKLRSTAMKTIPGWTHNLNGGSVRDQDDATCLAGNRVVHS